MAQPTVLRTLLDVDSDGTGRAMLAVDSDNPLLAEMLKLSALELDGDHFKSFGSAPMEFTGKLQRLGVRVCIGRLQQHAPLAPVGAGLVALVYHLAADRPAAGVLWAHAIAACYARTARPVGLRTFLDAWDGNLPAPSALHALWLEQKVALDQRQVMRAAGTYDTDNHLDYAWAWTPEALKAGAASS